MFLKHFQIWTCFFWALVCRWWWCDWSFAHCTAPVVTSAYIILRSNKIQNGDILVPNCLGCQIYKCVCWIADDNITGLSITRWQCCCHC